jgi:hypothetical protein
MNIAHITVLTTGQVITRIIDMPEFNLQECLKITSVLPEHTHLGEVGQLEDGATKTITIEYKMAKAFSYVTHVFARTA